EEIEEVRKWLSEAEGEVLELRGKVEKMEMERGGEEGGMMGRGKLVVEVGGVGRRRGSGGVESPDTAVNSPEGVEGRVEGGRGVDKASLIYLNRMSTQMLLCFFIVFAPMTLYNLTGSDLPNTWRVTSQVMGGVTGAILLNRPRK
ncbi:hypothetical protein HDU67_006049, partial [Dinochytrium kinnereticum]